MDDILAAEFRLTFVDVTPGRPGITQGQVDRAAAQRVLVDGMVQSQEVAKAVALVLSLHPALLQAQTQIKILDVITAGDRAVPAVTEMKELSNQ